MYQIARIVLKNGRESFLSIATANPHAISSALATTHAEQHQQLVSRAYA